MNSQLRYVAATLAVAAIGLGYVLIQGQAGRPAHRPPARAEATARPAALRPPLTARRILQQSATLSLTEDQTRGLETLDRQWSMEFGALEAPLKESEEDFSRLMREAQAGGKASLQEIQRRSAEFTERSAALRERRKRHAVRAASLLTEAQRRILAQAIPLQTPGGDQ